jgi:glutamate-ammonia-ligase adenylyltransferase
MADYAERFGRVTGGAMAVVLLGKAGGREMMTGSDLDLMLIYDHAPTATQSKGARPLPASQWFIRCVHAYVAALTAPDAEGPMYDVDMRLRPSGNKGPVAVSLAAFRTYHAEGGQAWTWERMALTRARVVAGPPKLRAQIEAVIKSATTGCDPTRIRADATAMRTRMSQQMAAPGPWDVKLRPGGQIEVEFTAQVLQLLHGLQSPTLRIAVSRLRAQGHITQAQSDLLIRADRVWRTVQGMLRITDGPRPPSPLSEASGQALLRAAARAGVEAVDLDDLRATLETLARDVRAVFTELVGEIENEPVRR